MSNYLVTFSLIGMLMGFGCASFEISHTPDGYDAPTIVVKSSAYGRGCVAVESDGNGAVSVVVAQDGTSDWSIGRLLDSIGSVAGSVFGANTSTDRMQGPDDANGCGQIYETSADPADGPVNTEE